jgi:hypothetical protein
MGLHPALRLGTGFLLMSSNMAKTSQQTRLCSVDTGDDTHTPLTMNLSPHLLNNNNICQFMNLPCQET